MNASTPFSLTHFYGSLQLPSQLPFPIQLHPYAELPSTNDHLQTLMAQGAPAGTAVLAQRQTRGRGQQGRVWQSPLGGLYLSLGLRPNLPATEGHRLTLGSAWGVAQILREKGFSVQLKWPNDLLLEGKKLGGILTESRIRGGTIHQAVVGLGLNCCNPVPDNAISLHSVRLKEPQARILRLEELSALVLRGLALGYVHWCRGASLAQLVAQYESLMANLNGFVGFGDETGTLKGITPAGELKVFVNCQERVFPPGTIKLRYDCL